MQTLTPCPSCHRHVLSDALRCPFCDAVGVFDHSPDFDAPSAPARVRNAVLALGATLAVGACSAPPPPPMVVIYGSPEMMQRLPPDDAGAPTTPTSPPRSTPKPDSAESSVASKHAPTRAPGR